MFTKINNLILKKFFIFLFALFLSSLLSSTESIAINSLERQALIDLYNSTNGNDWNFNMYWLGDSGTECNWYGIVCNDSYNIEALHLFSNNLNGEIPSSVKNLTYLKSLLLHNNTLFGSIPEEIFMLVNLESITFYNNKLATNIFTTSSQFFENKLIKSCESKSIEFNVMPGSPTSKIYDIWGYEKDSIFAVGFSGNIFYYNGSSWSKMSSGYSTNIYSVWGNSKDSVYAGGGWSSGDILHYDGNTWNIQYSTDSPINSIWGLSENNIYATSYNSILHYNGSQWSTVTANIVADYQSIWGASKDNIFVACSGGKIIHYDGIKWELINSPTANDLQKIWGNSSNSIFAVGTWSGPATIVYYNGSEWKEHASPISESLSSVYGNLNNVYATSYSGSLLSYNGQDWSEIYKHSTGGTGALWISSNNSIYIASDDGILYSEGINNNEKLYSQTELDQAVENERKKWDSNNDNKVGIEEAIYALQVSSMLLNNSNPNMVESITFPFNIDTPSGLSFDGNCFYISNYSQGSGKRYIHIFNIFDGSYQGDIKTPSEWAGNIAIEGQFIWLTDYYNDSNKILKISKKTGEIEHYFPISKSLGGLCLYDNKLYIAYGNTIELIDPTNGNIIDLIYTENTNEYSIVDLKHHNGSLWFVAKITNDDSKALLLNISTEGHKLSSKYIDIIGGGYIVAFEFVNNDLWYITHEWNDDCWCLRGSLYKYQ